VTLLSFLQLISPYPYILLLTLRGKGIIFTIDKPLSIHFTVYFKRERYEEKEERGK
jgi:hypothetical protein